MNSIYNSEKFKSIIFNLKNKNFDKALNLLEAFSGEINDIQTINRLYASIYFNKNDWEKSIIYYKKLLNVDYKKSEIYNNIGVALFNLGKINESIENFNKSCDENIHDELAYENLGLSHKQLGNYELAIKNFVKVLELNKNNYKIKENLIDIFNYYKPKDVEIHKILKINQKINNLNYNIFTKHPINPKDIKKFYESTIKIISNIDDNLIYSETQIFRRNKINLNCDRHFKVFNKFSVIPKYCFGCYKVQINIKNVVELIKLFFVFNNINLKNNNIRKCVIELRKNVKGNYKGYIFCSSIDEAKTIYNNICKILDDFYILTNKVEIKHGCTEYYETYPEFNDINLNGNQKMSYNPDWLEKEQYIDAKIPKRKLHDKKVFNATLKDINLSDVLIIKNWLSYAKIIGDISYKNICEENINTIFLSKILNNQIIFRKKDFIENQN